MKLTISALVVLTLVAFPATLVAQDQERICIPQFVDGTAGPFRWHTTLMIHNSEQTQTQARLRFFDNDGQPMEGLQLRERMGQGQSAQGGAGGLFETRPLGEGATRSYRSQGEGQFQAGYCLIESDVPLQVHARLQLYGTEGTLIGESGIIPTPQFRAGGFFADRTEGREVGFALMNSAQQGTAACTMEVWEEDGTEPLGTYDLELGPHSQTARYLKELFPDVLADGSGFVRISCDRPVCALALHLHGFQMLQIPVYIDEPEVNP